LKIISISWKNADQQTKDYYNAECKEAKELYQQEMALYEAYKKTHPRSGIFG